MASQLVASSSLPPSWRYHVFLSFRGEDTRTNFTDHLYHALVDKEIKTFIDRDLPRGEEISLSLLKTIEESRIALVIFSKNYASSRWCLEELVKIHQCRESKQQIILPVFYKVDPSHVRNQRGCYGDAFIGHERKFEDQEMVLMWRRALTKVANLSGYHVKEEDYEATIIGNIVKDILDRIPDDTYLKGSHLPKKSTYQLQITLDGYNFYEGEPFRDSQRVLRKSYDVWDDEIKQQQKILALRSNNNNKYLRYIHQRIENLDGLVQFSEEDVRSEYAKFQIEPAGSGYGGLVHIRCCFNNKYLRRANDRQYWIVAGANEPEEDKKHWSCTLFAPVVVHSNKKGVFRLLHVQLGHFVTSFTVNDFNQCLFADRNTPDLHNDMDVYTVVDLEPLVLPSPFVLKSNNNNKYLRYIHQCIENLDGLVQFSEEDVKSEYAKFQIKPADSGYGGLVHIKCCFNNRYLRRANRWQYWIVAGADEPEEDKKHWSCTLFEPVVVHSDNKAVVRLLHVQLGHFVKSFTVNDFNQCLFAERKTPDLYNDMDVYTVVDLEPLVLPSPFVLKSNNNNRYLRYMLDQENNIHQILQFSAQDHTSEFAQFQVERANSRDHQNNHYVHIKCLYNNKYLRRMDVNRPLILAAADDRDEDTGRWTCTLFKPESVGPTGNNRNNVLCRLRHVATGLYTKPFVDNKLELRLGEEKPDPREVDVYTAIRTHT